MFHKIMLVAVLFTSLIAMWWDQISFGEQMIILILYFGFQCLIEKKDK